MFEFSLFLSVFVRGEKQKISNSFSFEIITKPKLLMLEPKSSEVNDFDVKNQDLFTIFEKLGQSCFFIV